MRSDTVARIGGDECCVLVNGAFDADERVGLSRRIFEMERAPIALPGIAALSCSIGIARFPTPGATLAALPKGSDAAVYAVKRHGKTSVDLAA